MPGSRKGERRGGAKPGRPRKPGNPNLRKGGLALPGAGRRKGSKNKPKTDPALSALLNRPMAPAKREKELELYFVASGKRQRMPREVMLDVMRYFEETGIEYGEVLRANMRMAAQAEDEGERALLQAAVGHSESQMEKYLLLAADIGARAAPFCHPRLAAIMTQPGAEGGPQNLLRQLMQDLDEAGRPARYIDHIPGEVAK